GARSCPPGGRPSSTGALRLAGGATIAAVTPAQPPPTMITFSINKILAHDASYGAYKHSGCCHSFRGVNGGSLCSPETSHAVTCTTVWCKPATPENGPRSSYHSWVSPFPSVARTTSV